MNFREAAWDIMPLYEVGEWQEFREDTVLKRYKRRGDVTRFLNDLALSDDFMQEDSSDNYYVDILSGTDWEDNIFWLRVPASFWLFFVASKKRDWCP